MGAHHTLLRNEARIWDEGPSGQVTGWRLPKPYPKSRLQSSPYLPSLIFLCNHTHRPISHSFHPTTTPSQHPHAACTLSSTSSQRAWLGGRGQAGSTQESELILSQVGSTQENELIRPPEHSAHLAGNICRV